MSSPFRRLLWWLFGGLLFQRRSQNLLVLLDHALDLFVQDLFSDVQLDEALVVRRLQLVQVLGKLCANLFIKMATNKLSQKLVSMEFPSSTY